VDNVIVWVQEPTQNDRFRALGVRVLNPAYSTVLILERMVLNPALADITPDMDASQTVREVKLQNSQFIDWRLADLKLPGDVLVLMIERKGDVLVPQRDTVLRAN
jgi:Trk K+ transport system NAD-binding subunit